MEVQAVNKIYTRFGVDKIDANGVRIEGQRYDLKKTDDFYYAFVGLDLLDLKNFVLDMEKNIQNQKDELKEKDCYAFDPFFSEDYNQAYRIGTRYYFLLRNSVFISIYSLLEDSLNNICKHYKRNYSNQPYNSNSKGFYINEAKRFIESQMGGAFLEEEWHLLNQYRLIRNKIVHNKGIVSNSGQVISAIHRLNGTGISLQDQRIIELDNTACINFIELIEKVLFSLCKSFAFLD